MNDNTGRQKVQQKRRRQHTPTDVRPASGPGRGEKDHNTVYSYCCMSKDISVGKDYDVFTTA